MKIHETRNLYLHVFQEESGELGSWASYPVRCDGCKHWDEDGVCTRITMMPGSASVVTEYGYGIRLETKSDFGCNQFEPKETT